MKLSELLQYDRILIQCHDNPDPDALASGYGLYEYFKSHKKDVHMIYCGRERVRKSNIKLMIEAMDIPVEYYDDYKKGQAGLGSRDVLITVDCQYGESNVTHIDAEHVVIIDHHQVSPKLVYDSNTMDIRPELGSCSTHVWSMLNQEHFNVNENLKLSSALYYGLSTDTGDFSEISYPLDKDMKDELLFDKMLIIQLNNSKISLAELEIAGVALIKYVYNTEHRYALIHAKPCDPNVLGYIIDLVLQVDVIDTCVVYNDKEDGYKFSVRSCIKDVKANELAAYIAEGMGGGGGHIDKAGGFIMLPKYQELQKEMDIDTFMAIRMNTYFTTSEIIHCGEYELDTTDMKLCAKKKMIVGFVDPSEILPVGSEIQIRTLEGDITLEISAEEYIMIGILGEVYPISKKRFANDYEVVDQKYNLVTEYMPSLRCNTTGDIIPNLTKYAKSCRACHSSQILAKPIDHIMKIYTMWDQQSYYLGKPGDYVACKVNDPKDIYIIRQDVFAMTYEEI